MHLPDFIFVDPPLDSNSPGYILYTHPPLYMGKILKIEREQDYYEFLSNLSYPVGKVDGYRILVLPAGTLNEYDKIQDVSEAILSDMAGFYLSSRVIVRPHGFKRLRIA